MKNIVASVLALGIAGMAMGCGSLPGIGECKFAKGEVVASAQGDVKAFLDSAMDLKKTADGLEAEWQAEIKAMAGELKVEAATEEGVLAKLSANVAELKAKGQCEVKFEAKMDASASGSAAGGGSCGSGCPWTWGSGCWTVDSPGVRPEGVCAAASAPGAGASGAT